MSTHRTRGFAVSGPGPQRGFTFVELLVAIALIAVLVVFSATVVANLTQASALRTAVSDTKAAIVDARADTLAAEADTFHSVRIAEDHIVSYLGGTYDPDAAGNVVVHFPRAVRATTSLTDAVTDIAFSRLTGDASATGTITLFERDSGASTTLTIYRSGLIE